MTVIQVRGLTKRYGTRAVLHDVDLSVRAGTVFGLLGPNGAGKTSTIEILEGFRERTAGDVEVLGVDPARGGAVFRDRIGIMLQDGGVEPYLTVAEALDATRGYYRHSRPRDELLEAVDLAAQASTRVRRLSAGQRRRLELALATCGTPELLFLDEPTLGFDPVARRAAWRWIRELASAGTTVMVTTNALDEAGALADRLAILVEGTVVAQGTLAEVIGAKATGTVIRFRLAEGVSPLPDDLMRVRRSVAGGAVELHTVEPVRTLHELTEWALARDVELHELSAWPRSLEEAYLEVVGAAGT